MIHQRTFMVGLENIHFNAFLLAIVIDHILQIHIGFCAIYMFFTNPQHIQIGAVDNQYFHRNASLNDFRIAAQERELFRREIHIFQEGNDIFGIDRGFHVEIETEFEIFSGNWSAFQFGQIDAFCRDFTQHSIQRTGMMRNGQHQADFIGTGVDFHIFCDTDEACVVVLVVLDVIFHHL